MPLQVCKMAVQPISVRQRNLWIRNRASVVNAFPIHCAPMDCKILCFQGVCASLWFQGLTIFDELPLLGLHTTWDACWCQLNRPEGWSYQCGRKSSQPPTPCPFWHMVPTFANEIYPHAKRATRAIWHDWCSSLKFTAIHRPSAPIGKKKMRRTQKPLHQQGTQHVDLSTLALQRALALTLTKTHDPSGNSTIKLLPSFSFSFCRKASSSSELAIFIVCWTKTADTTWTIHTYISWSAARAPAQTLILCSANLWWRRGVFSKLLY